MYYIGISWGWREFIILSVILPVNITDVLYVQMRLIKTVTVIYSCCDNDIVILLRSHNRSDIGLVEFQLSSN